MQYNTFLKVLLTYQKFEKDIDELYKIGFNLFDGKYKLLDLFYSTIIAMLSEFYNDEGIEWVEWFIFENEYGHKAWGEGKCGAYDENNNPICCDFQSLWEYLEKNHKL